MVKSGFKCDFLEQQKFSLSSSKLWFWVREWFGFIFKPKKNQSFSKHPLSGQGIDTEEQSASGIWTQDIKYSKRKCYL